MANKPKYIEVLKFLYEKRCSGDWYTHYYDLRNVIFTEEIVKKYNISRGRKVVIDTMVCSYMGKLERKGLIDTQYSHNDCGTSFEGYIITNKGMNFIKNI